MKLYRPPANLKFLYAYSLPPLFVLLSIIGMGGSGPYVLLATLMTMVGAICVASSAKWSGKRYVAGLVYLVAVEALLIILH